MGWCGRFAVGATHLLHLLGRDHAGAQIFQLGEPGSELVETLFQHSGVITNAHCTPLGPLKDRPRQPGKLCDRKCGGEGTVPIESAAHRRSASAAKMAQGPHIANAEKINFPGYDRSVGLSPVTAPAVGGFWGGEAGAAGGAWTFGEGQATVD